MCECNLILLIRIIDGLINLNYQLFIIFIYRPRIINMEPLTGVLLIQQDYFEKNLVTNIKNLSSSIRVMGQQLCSSPTIGFLINYNLNESLDSIFKNLIIDMENNYNPVSSYEGNSIKLDRMINIARDKGSKVYTSSKYSNNVKTWDAINTFIIMFMGSLALYILIEIFFNIRNYFY